MEVNISQRKLLIFNVMMLTIATNRVNGSSLRESISKNFENFDLNFETRRDFRLLVEKAIESLTYRSFQA